MMIDKDETARRVARAFRSAADKLHDERGVPDAEIGKAMVAIGLSFWSKAATSASLVEQMASLIGGIADAAGIDLEKPVEVHARH